MQHDDPHQASNKRSSVKKQTNKEEEDYKSYRAVLPFGGIQTASFQQN